MARKLSGFKDDPVDGIVGLAFTSIAVKGVTPPLIAAIDQNILKPSLFTVWLSHQVKFSDFLINYFDFTKIYLKFNFSYSTVLA